MANEFRIKHGLIVTGSSYFSESMFAPNLPEETSPDYYITWRQSDGRFEVTPKGAAAAVLAIGCWGYSGYADASPSNGEFSLRGDSSNDLEQATVLYFNKIDSDGTDQSTYFNNIGVGSVLTFTTDNNIIKFEVTGFNISGNIYTFSVTHLSGAETLSLSEEICLTPTTISSGGSASSNTSGTSGGGTGTFNSPQCNTYIMTDTYNEISNGTLYKGIFNNPPGFATPFGEITTDTAGLFVVQDPLYGTQSTVFFGMTLNALSTAPAPIELSYLNLKTRFNAYITIGPGGQGTTASYIYVDLTYVSGDTNYTIPTGASFTICGV